jgi:hypothetical protein
MTPILVEGFTLIGGVESLLVGGEALIEVKSCRLIDNRDRAGEFSNANAVLRDCLIAGNSWDEPQDYALFVLNAQLELYGCTIQDNFAHALRVIGSDRIVMDGCWVSDHKLRRACEFENVSDLRISNSWFVRNSTIGNGGAIVTGDNVSGEIDFCVFAYDSASSGGAIGGGPVRMTNNTFYRCHANLGSAVSMSATDPGFDNNIVAYSTGANGSVWRSQGANSPLTGCNIFWENEGGDFAPIGTWTPAPTDIFADPQFCDHVNEDLTLRSTSPGAPENPGCGAIGASGVGCGPVPVEDRSWGWINLDGGRQHE